MAEEGITKRADDFSQWYLDIVLRAQLADYSPVRGCMVIRPNGYAVWELLQKALDTMIKETGHKNAYFPLLIPESFLKREAEHVEGFAPETAVVTHGGGKLLEEPLIIRPTSETIIYDMYSKWIMSYRDLPLLINQWANVVRWEMRTRLFLRTTEFLWQEGHTAHATAEEGEEETLKMLEVYKTLSEDVMAIPVLTGQKTESEKFAGALRTYAIEAMMQDGKALQAGTSHNLGQNFSKVFNVRFQDEQGQMQNCWQTSWGVSTRLIGAVIMAHSDDKGLILPPKLAPTEAVIIPIYKTDDEKRLVMEKARAIEAGLKQRFRLKVDDRDQFTPGWKYADAELIGIPVRIEVGPRDVAKDQAVLVRRDNRQKSFVAISEIDKALRETLDQLQVDLFQKALKHREEKTHQVESWDEFLKTNTEKGGFIEGCWCGSPLCEEKVKEETKATIRVLPFGQDDSNKGPCLVCGKDSPHRVVWSQSY
ncbi:MAG: proline--tRNA ligase [Candidatus Eisenbacteria bacterium]|nr:proline--tRNA ligase [Candidatus Eisenbacteria bacterium]